MMEIITATELNKCPGTYLNEAMKSPVIVKKAGVPVAVIVSYDNYIKLEDAYWGELALKSDKEKSLKVEESLDFLSSDE